jgi:hypothetical protein
MAVARQCPRSRPWPVTPKADAIARRKVGDLTGDPRLAQRLASELVRWAARWWDAPVLA